MELRLRLGGDGESTIVNVDGRLAAETVRELQRLISSVAAPIVLDLRNLLSLDDAGVVALRELTSRGVALRGMSPYVALLVDAPTRLPGQDKKGRSP